MPRFLLLAFVLLSCSNKKATESTATCDKQVTELAQWLQVLRKEGGENYPGPKSRVQLVALESAKTVGTSEVFVQISPKGILYDHDIFFLPEAEGFLEALQAREEADVFTLDLAIDQKATWLAATQVISLAASAGFTKIRLLFEGPAPTRTLVVPKLSAKNEKWVAGLRGPYTDESRQAANPTNSHGDWGANCPALGEVLNKVAEADASRKPDVLIGLIPAALTECGCKQDVEDLKAGLYHGLFASFGALPIGGIEFTLANAANKEARVVEASGQTSWQAVHSKFSGLEGETLLLKALDSD